MREQAGAAGAHGGQLSEKTREAEAAAKSQISAALGGLSILVSLICSRNVFAGSHNEEKRQKKTIGFNRNPGNSETIIARTA